MSIYEQYLSIQYNENKGSKVQNCDVNFVIFIIFQKENIFFKQKNIRGNMTRLKFFQWGRLFFRLILFLYIIYIV